MLRPITILAALASLAAAGSLAAQEPAAPDVVEAVADGPARIDMQEVVCRNVRPPTGTRLQKRRTERVCMTRAEWDHQSQEAQDARRRMDNGTCGPKCNLEQPMKF